VLPPFPGYLFIAYPELVVSFVFLAGLAVLVHARGMAGAVAAGVLYALGALFRETLLLALPLYLVGLPPRTRWRAFVPAAAATLFLIVIPLAGHRAVHPNGLYPSALEEARRSEQPLAALARPYSATSAPTCAPPPAWTRRRARRTRCWPSSSCWRRRPHWARGASLPRRGAWPR